MVPDSSLAQPHVYFPDPDDDTHVYRAKKIADGSLVRWGVMKDLDAPPGVELHWTAPMDYLTAAAGLLGEKFIGGAQGFESGAAVLPVVLGCVYLLVLMAWIRRIAGNGPALCGGLLAAVSPPFLRVFEFGHADHHALLELCLLAVLFSLPDAARYRAANDHVGRGRFRDRFGGVAMGAAIWTSAVAMLFWAAILLVQVAIILRSGGPDRMASGAALRRWSAAALVTTLIGCLIENLDHPLAVTFDKISLFQAGWLFTALILSIWICDLANPAATRPARSTPRRWGLPTIGFGLTAIVGIAGLAGATELGNPALSRWHAHIAELQPMIAPIAPPADSDLPGDYSLTPLHEHLGYLPYLLPITLPLFAMCRRVPRETRWVLATLSLLITGLSILQLRWMDHYTTFVVPVVVIGLSKTMTRFGRLIRQPRAGFAVAAMSILLGVAAFPFNTWGRLSLVSRAGAAASDDPDRRHPQTQSLLRSLAPREDQTRTDFVARAIRQHEQSDAASATRRAILCDEGEGPTLLNETGLPVVAAPYHRALDGILEMMNFFAGRDATAARQRLDRLGVRYIVVPYRVNEQLLNYEEIAFGAPRSFDPPLSHRDERGRLRRELRYRPEVTQTMAYRLAIAPRDHGIAGVELLYGICDDPRRPNEMHGLLFIVHEAAAPR